jgi:hypothetical protein
MSLLNGISLLSIGHWWILSIRMHMCHCNPRYHSKIRLDSLNRVQFSNGILHSRLGLDRISKGLVGSTSKWLAYKGDQVIHRRWSVATWNSTLRDVPTDDMAWCISLLCML